MLVRESISFQRGKDPKEVLGIGTKTWEKLKIGNVLYTKENANISHRGYINYRSDYSSMNVGDIMVIENIEKDLKKWIICGHVYWGMYAFINKRYGQHLCIIASLNVLKRKFDIIE
jgi:hypothetical protein